MATEVGRHERPRRELLPGVTVRAALLVLGVLLLQFGFVFSYVQAFHSPTPREIPVAVVAPAGAPPGTAEQVAAALAGLDGAPLAARAVTGERAARDLLADREVDGVLLLRAAPPDTLLVAGAGGGAVSTALTEVVSRVEAAQQRTVTTEDAIPAGGSDARGLSAFYLAVGWVVGGYLVAAIIGVHNGYRPRTRARGAVRLGAVALYAVLSGIGGALITGPVLDVFDGGVLGLAAFGSLVVFAVAAVTLALQAWLGLVGIGLSILIFVVLGNPSAGGAYPAPLLPPFWAAIGPWLPPGAATDAIRGIVYFDGAGAGRAALVLAGYALVGLLATLAGAGWRTARPGMVDGEVVGQEDPAPGTDLDLATSEGRTPALSEART